MCNVNTNVFCKFVRLITISYVPGRNELFSWSSHEKTLSERIWTELNWTIFDTYD